jgi:hypothetical protein
VSDCTCCPAAPACPSVLLFLLKALQAAQNERVGHRLQHFSKGPTLPGSQLLLPLLVELLRRKLLRRKLLRRKLPTQPMLCNL